LPPFPDSRIFFVLARTALVGSGPLFSTRNGNIGFFLPAWALFSLQSRFFFGPWFGRSPLLVDSFFLVSFSSPTSNGLPPGFFPPVYVLFPQGNFLSLFIWGLRTTWFFFACPPPTILFLFLHSPPLPFIFFGHLTLLIVFVLLKPLSPWRQAQFFFWAFFHFFHAHFPPGFPSPLLPF